MKLLAEQITIINADEAKLLQADRYTKGTGLYLVCEPNEYTALDYKERMNWAEYFGSYDNAPTGYSKQFENPLAAIDWLLA